MIHYKNKNIKNVLLRTYLVFQFLPFIISMFINYLYTFLVYCFNKLFSVAKYCSVKKSIYQCSTIRQNKCRSQDLLHHLEELGEKMHKRKPIFFSLRIMERFCKLLNQLSIFQQNDKSERRVVIFAFFHFRFIKDIINNTTLTLSVKSFSWRKISNVGQKYVSYGSCRIF